MAPGRVLVTGGTGVIGAWVVRGFVERGITPIVFVRGTSDDIGRAINGDVIDRIVTVHGDLMEPASVERAVEEHGPDVVVHMATAKPWQIEPPFVPDPHPRLGIEQITVATANLLEVSRKAGIKRFVYASSKGVYGDITGRFSEPTYEPLHEDYSCNPRMIYGIGKLAAEHLGFYYNRQFGMQFLTIRFSSSFGPLKRGPKETSPDGLLVTALEEGHIRVRRFRPGEADDYCYNRDVAESFVLAALAEKPRHRAYNIGSGVGLTPDDIAAAITRVLPKTTVELLDPRTTTMGSDIIDRARCVMDISRAARDFGYEPRYFPLEVAFEDFLRVEERIKQQRALAA